jgi:hypothetical protein
MKFESLKPEMIVWDVARRKMGNTTRSTVSVWMVKIISVDSTRRTVVASWNGNRESTYSERIVKRWRKEKPMLISTGMSGARRLATREEIKAVKAKEK